MQVCRRFLRRPHQQTQVVAGSQLPDDMAIDPPNLGELRIPARSLGID
jgi:hypothetical protein